MEWSRLMHGLSSLGIQVAPVSEKASSSDSNWLGYAIDNCRHYLYDDFLQYACNLSSLSLTGDKNGYIGGPKSSQPVRWEQFWLPNLRHFELHGVHISQGLVDAMQDLTPRLKLLHLLDCYTDRRTAWLNLFLEICHIDPTELTDFDVSQASPDIYFEEGMIAAVKMKDLGVDHLFLNESFGAIEFMAESNNLRGRPCDSDNVDLSSVMRALAKVDAIV
ncbi:hypothetical protein HIM_09253 [Hirsutella minnesotensis 3608]|uniref:Uncharacterized protein n=1 Tax=Hirsutella minnesotensis 3608 TaxID=1043627 RepID=A0A0F7ZLR4_9HYPO|nr:hypothetical protein HIM_09253 [Hirsutella minnesotensis 3608]